MCGIVNTKLLPSILVGTQEQWQYPGLFWRSSGHISSTTQAEGTPQLELDILGGNLWLKKKKEFPLVLEIVSHSHSPVSFLSIPSAEITRLHQFIWLRNIYWRFIMWKPNIIMWYGFCPSVVWYTTVELVFDLELQVTWDFSIEDKKVDFFGPKVMSSSILRLHALWLGRTLEIVLRILCNERDWSCSVCF